MSKRSVPLSKEEEAYRRKLEQKKAKVAVEKPFEVAEAERIELLQQALEYRNLFGDEEDYQDPLDLLGNTQDDIVMKELVQIARSNDLLFDMLTRADQLHTTQTHSYEYSIVTAMLQVLIALLSAKSPSSAELNKLREMQTKQNVIWNERRQRQLKQQGDRKENVLVNAAQLIGKGPFIFQKSESGRYEPRLIGNGSMSMSSTEKIFVLYPSDTLETQLLIQSQMYQENTRKMFLRHVQTYKNIELQLKSLNPSDPNNQLFRQLLTLMVHAYDPVDYFIAIEGPYFLRAWTGKMTDKIPYDENGQRLKEIESDPNFYATPEKIGNPTAAELNQIKASIPKVVDDTLVEYITPNITILDAINDPAGMKKAALQSRFAKKTAEFMEDFKKPLAESMYKASKPASYQEKSIASQDLQKYRLRTELAEFRQRSIRKAAHDILENRPVLKERFFGKRLDASESALVYFQRALSEFSTKQCKQRMCSIPCVLEFIQHQPILKHRYNTHLFEFPDKKQTLLDRYGPIDLLKTIKQFECFFRVQEPPILMLPSDQPLWSALLPSDVRHMLPTEKLKEMLPQIEAILADIPNETDRSKLLQCILDSTLLDALTKLMTVQRCMQLGIGFDEKLVNQVCDLLIENERVLEDVQNSLDEELRVLRVKRPHLTVEHFVVLFEALFPFVLPKSLSPSPSPKSSPEKPKPVVRIPAVSGPRFNDLALSVYLETSDLPMWLKLARGIDAVRKIPIYLHFKTQGLLDVTSDFDTKSAQQIESDFHMLDDDVYVELKKDILREDIVDDDLQTKYPHLFVSPSYYFLQKLFEENGLEVTPDEIKTDVVSKMNLHMRQKCSIDVLVSFDKWKTCMEPIVQTLIDLQKGSVIQQHVEPEVKALKALKASVPYSRKPISELSDDVQLFFRELEKDLAEPEDIFEEETIVVRASPTMPVVASSSVQQERATKMVVDEMDSVAVDESVNTSQVDRDHVNLKFGRKKPKANLSTPVRKLIKKMKTFQI